MPLKKVAVLTIFLLMPSLVSFIMCPVAHSLSASKCQQLVVVQKQFPKNKLQQKEFASSPLWQTSLTPLNLQAHGKTVIHVLQPSAVLECSNNLTLLKTTRINV
jgi:hypothetical protein